MEIRGLQRTVAVLCAAAAVLCLSGGAAAWNHSEIEWLTIETEHFSIHYHAEVERSALEVARIAEEVYGPITSLYGYEPDRVHINVTDRAGLPEGASYYYLDRIDIDTDDVEFQLRGTANWLRNVVTHEFSHMVSLQVSMKMPRWLPAIFLQGFGFEKEKRPDVITGYPNFIGSLPLAGEIVPNWLAEGVAQYQAEGSHNDIWDSHRDMLLRTAVLGGTLLDLDRMGVFGKNSLEAEMLYNQGYSLVRFIAARYGDEAVAQIIRAHHAWYRTGFGGACRSVLDISDSQLYDAWKAEITTRYGEVEARIGKDTRTGEPAAGEGFLNMHPVADADGGLYYVSNRGRDYRDMDLVYRDAGGTIVTIAADLASGADLSRDRSMLCYARRTDDNPHGYRFDDIFLLDAATGKEHRLTRGLRATDPSFSGDGSQIVAVASSGCGDRLVLVNVADGSTAELVAEIPGRRFFWPVWGEGGILVSVFKGTSRDIAAVDPGTGELRTIVGTAADERDPRWCADGAGFLYTSDRTGVFDVYYASPERGDLMVTRVTGGAFQPYEAGNDLYFASFSAEGYAIRRLERWRSVATPVDPAEDDGDLMARRERFIGCPSSGPVPAGAEEPRRFKVTYTPPFLFPRLMVYDGSFRVGLAVDSRDQLDRQAVYAAGSAGFDGEFDAQLGFEVRQFKPTFRFDVLRMRKYHEYTDPLAGDVKVRYDLWDAYFAAVLELSEPTLMHRRDITLLYNHGEYGLNINAWNVYDYEIGWTYYKADEYSLLFDYRTVRRGIDAQINPRRGRTMHGEATLSKSRLQSGEFEYSFQPLYDRNDFSRFVVSYEEYLPLPFWSHALTVYGRVGWIDRENIDDFFYLYLGSRDGLRGYSYYSIGGTKNAMGRVTYRFPILRSIERQLPVFYLRSLYGAVFAEAGKAWNENKFDLNGNNKDVGYELRMDGFTFFSYPLALSFIGAYGLDTIEYRDPFYETVVFTEGKEWRYYGSVLFSF